MRRGYTARIVAVKSNQSIDIRFRGYLITPERQAKPHNDGDSARKDIGELQSNSPPSCFIVIHTLFNKMAYFNIYQRSEYSLAASTINSQFQNDFMIQSPNSTTTQPMFFFLFLFMRNSDFDCFRKSSRDDFACLLPVFRVWSLSVAVKQQPFLSSTSGLSRIC